MSSLAQAATRPKSLLVVPMLKEDKLVGASRDMVRKDIDAWLKSQP
jgi:hypothetical protein